MNTKCDLTGYWTGELQGTNFGGVTLDIKQNGDVLSGVGKFSEPALGQYEYIISGSVSDTVSLRLTPGRNPQGLNLGLVNAIGELESPDVITGRWKSNIGTEGVFSVKRFNSNKMESKLPQTNSVFLVHGHDGEAKHSVARFLEQLGVKPVILHEQINRGMTVLEKFEEFANRAGFAVILMTPDDKGFPVGKEATTTFRARQNVILEMGYFAAKLGRDKTMVLTKGDIELPSDVFGLVYEKMDQNDGWKMSLARELKASDFDVDLNKAI